MTGARLAKDPYNVIITGVGGQGNVIASRVLANILVREGLYVTIGETFGASQRGGSVMSHLRISEKGTWSPLMPKGGADVIVALEPTEAVRVLGEYGNPGVKIVSNTRPIHAVGVIAGDLDYPSLEATKKSADELSKKAWFVDATDEALKLGNPILGNVIMLGALAEVSGLPMTPDTFRDVMAKVIPADRLPVNVKAFELGKSLVRQ